MLNTATGRMTSKVNARKMPDLKNSFMILASNLRGILRRISRSVPSLLLRV